MANDREMILTPEWWPLPMLPVKRYNDLHEIEVGVILADHRTRVYLSSMYEIAERADAGTLSHTDYDNVESLLADRWVVD